MIFRETTFAECGPQKQAWCVRSRKAPSQFFIALCQNKLMLMMILTSSQGFRVMYITNPCSPSLRYITYYPSNVCCAFWYKKCTYLSQFPLFWTVKNIKTFSGFDHFFFRKPASTLVYLRGGRKKVDYFVETQNILLILGLPSPTIYQINGNFMRIPQNFTKLR